MGPLPVLIFLFFSPGSPCAADVLVTGLTSDRFASGTPLPGSFTNSIEFIPYGAVQFPTINVENPFEATGIMPLGRFYFANGQTLLGTTTTPARLRSQGVALITDIIPNVSVPVVADWVIPFIPTPNVTGDPFQDADPWYFPDITVWVPEDATGYVVAHGRLVGVNWASPPEYYRIELVRLEAGEGGLWVTTIPAPGALLLGSVGVGLVGYMRRRRAL